MTQKLFTMEQGDYDSMVEKMTAARNTPLIALQCGMPQSPQEVANDCWKDLGKRMGFVWDTVQPGPSKLHFYAEPIEELHQ